MYRGAHFATFPIDLIIPCIQAGSPKGGLVLDPFMGSGTVAFVSKRLGRDYTGVELNPDYHKIIYERTKQEELF
jgi:DNA modification methylase